MKGVYLQKNSPYYWIRYYDKFEQNDTRKRKSINTKIEVTPSDLKRFQKKEKLLSTTELRNKVKGFRDALTNRNIEL